MISSLFIIYSTLLAGFQGFFIFFLKYRNRTKIVKDRGTIVAQYAHYMLTIGLNMLIIGFYLGLFSLCQEYTFATKDWKTHKKRTKKGLKKR